jgi:hypothetical protein
MVKYANILILITLMAAVGCDSNERENVKENSGFNTVEGDTQPTEEQNDNDVERSGFDRVSVIDNARLYKDPPEIKCPQGESKIRYTEHPRWTFVRFVLTSSDGYTELVITDDGLKRLASKEEWLPAYRVEPRKGDSIELRPDVSDTDDESGTAYPVLNKGEIVAVYAEKGINETVKVTDKSGVTGYVYRDTLTPLGDERKLGSAE